MRSWWDGGRDNMKAGWVGEAGWHDRRSAVRSAWVFGPWMHGVGGTGSGSWRGARDVSVICRLPLPPREEIIQAEGELRCLSAMSPWEFRLGPYLV